MNIVVIFCLVNLLWSPVSSYKIFMLSANVNSHLIYIGRMGSGLGKLGHQVVMPVPNNSKIPWDLSNDNFTIIPYKVNSTLPFFNTKEASDKYMEYALDRNKVSGYLEFGRWTSHEAASAMNKDCECLLENKEFMNQVINETKFDFIIMDFPVSECFYVFVKVLNVPFAVMTVPLLPFNFGVPRLPSLNPAFGLALTDKMTFSERFLGLVSGLISLAAMKAVSNPSNIPEYLPYRSTGHYNMIDAIKKASLLFYLEDPAVNYPSPNMPDVISVGDVSSGIPGVKLPQKISDFLSSSDAVYISFGSFFEYLREDLIQKFCKTVDLLEPVKVIWKMKNELICDSKKSNLMVLPWVPQNDLLADERIKIFITHGGFNSLIESIYHATPVIVFPLGGDQPSQAKLSADRGYGIQMDLRYWTPEDLASNIIEMLSNSSYRLKAKHYSDILKSRHDTPAERASIAITEVLRFGTDHLRSSARELYWFQFMMFDLFLLLLTIVFVFCAIVIYPLYKFIKFIIFKTFSRKQKAKLS